MPITARTLPQQRPRRRKGVSGFVRSVLEAPGGEFGPAPLAMPGMVAEKGTIPIARYIAKRAPAVVKRLSKAAEVVPFKQGKPLEQELGALRTKISQLKTRAATYRARGQTGPSEIRQKLIRLQDRERTLRARSSRRLRGR